jgi:hypothetical protein
MNRGVALGIHLSTAVLTATGMLLVWMVLLEELPEITEEEFFAVEHPGQALTTNIHILTGPTLLFLVGMIWISHVWTRIRNNDPARRRTGLALTWLFPLLIISGYGLQVTTGETLREVLGWSHTLTGIGFAVVYGVHLCMRTPAPLTLDEFKALSQKTEPRP